MAFTEIIVDVLDSDGYETGRSVGVCIEYRMEGDGSYGEDADGQRGTGLVSYDIIDAWTDAVLLKEEEEQVIEAARRQFELEPLRYRVRPNHRQYSWV